MHASKSLDVAPCDVAPCDVAPCDVAARMGASALMFCGGCIIFRLSSPFSLSFPLPLMTGGASGSAVSDGVGEDGDQVLQAEVQGR
jgi:hypothetical protein